MLVAVVVGSTLTPRAVTVHSLFTMLADVAL